MVDPDLAVEIDLGQLAGAAGGSQGIHFHQGEEQGEAGIADESPLPSGEGLGIADLPGKGKHVMANQPLHVGAHLLGDPKTGQQRPGHPVTFPVMAEGAQAAVNLSGGGCLADIVQQRRPSQPPVAAGRQIAYRQQGMGQGIPFRMIIRRLGNLGQSVDFGEERAQPRMVPEEAMALFRIGVKQSTFDKGQGVHAFI